MGYKTVSVSALKMDVFSPGKVDTAHNSHLIGISGLQREWQEVYEKK